MTAPNLPQVIADLERLFTAYFVKRGTTQDEARIKSACSRISVNGSGDFIYDWPAATKGRCFMCHLDAEAIAEKHFETLFLDLGSDGGELNIGMDKDDYYVWVDDKPFRSGHKLLAIKAAMEAINAQR